MLWFHRLNSTVLKDTNYMILEVVMFQHNSNDCAEFFKFTTVNHTSSLLVPDISWQVLLAWIKDLVAKALSHTYLSIYSFAFFLFFSCFSSVTEVTELQFPCIRVIVVKSAKLKVGSLFIITYTGGTIGR